MFWKCIFNVIFKNFPVGRVLPPLRVLLRKRDFSFNEQKERPRLYKGRSRNTGREEGQVQFHFNFFGKFPFSNFEREKSRIIASRLSPKIIFENSSRPVRFESFPQRTGELQEIYSLPYVGPVPSRPVLNGNASWEHTCKPLF